MRDVHKTRENFEKLFVQRCGKLPQKGVLIKFNLRAYCLFSDKGLAEPVNANTILDNKRPDVVVYEVVSDPFYDWGCWRVQLQSTDKQYPAYMQTFAISQAELKRASFWKES